MGKNRDRVTIVAAVLEAANHGARKTRIMYRANVSFGLVEKYLEIALNADLLRLVGSWYELTERGREFLKEYRDFHENYDRTRKMFEHLDSVHARLSRMCMGQKLAGAACPYAEGAR